MALYPGDPRVTVNGLELEALCSLGLYVREHGGDPWKPSHAADGYEAALCRVAASLVQAVAMAGAVQEARVCLSDGQPVGSWIEDLPAFDADEARIALGGIAAILRNMPRLVRDLREAQPLPLDGKPESPEASDDEDDEDDEPLDPTDPQRCNLPRGEP